MIENLGQRKYSAVHQSRILLWISVLVKREEKAEPIAVWVAVQSDSQFCWCVQQSGCTCSSIGDLRRAWQGCSIDEYIKDCDVCSAVMKKCGNKPPRSKTWNGGGYILLQERQNLRLDGPPTHCTPDSGF